MHVRLKGINWTTKVLADGRRVRFYYAWRGGPRLSGEPGSPEFIASYNAAVTRKIVEPTRTLSSVIVNYQRSTAFTDLSERTRADYAKHVVTIGAISGTFL